MNALRNFDDEPSATQKPLNNADIKSANSESKTLKRTHTSSLCASTMIPNATLLPPSQDYDDDDNNERDVDVVEVVFTSPTKTVLRTFVTKNPRSGKPSYLSQFYNVEGYSVETTYKIVGKKANGADKLVRHGLQTWRDNFKQVVRTRTFEDGKLFGIDTIFCYPVKLMRVFGGEPEEFVQVHLDRQIVCERTFAFGILQGLQVRNEFDQKTDKETNQTFFVQANTRMSTEFRDGVKHGKESRTRISDGKVLYSAHFEKGLKHGLFQHFTLSKMISSWNYVNGTLISGLTYFRNSTQIKRQLVNHHETGAVFTVFNKKGEIVGQTHYNSQKKKHGEQILLVEGKPQTWTWNAGVRTDPPQSSRAKKTKRTKVIDVDDDETALQQ